MGDSEKLKSWKDRKQSIKHKCFVPFIFGEWLCEWASYLLGQWAFLDILARLGHLAIVVAVIFYIKGCPERQMQALDQRKAKHYQAWQVINAARGQRHSGGRIQALQDLRQEEVSLAGVDISKAYLPELNLAKVDLDGANLAEAILVEANLVEAILNDANLTGADLQEVDMSGADLSNTNLSHANLVDIKNFQKIRNIKLANVYGVKNPPEGFIEWATAPKQGAVSFDFDEWNNLISEKRQEQTKEKR